MGPDRELNPRLFCYRRMLQLTEPHLPGPHYYFHNWWCVHLNPFQHFLNFIYLFLERGEGKEKEREWNINVRLPLACSLQGTWPANQACALTGNRIDDPLVHRPALNPLRHTSQGSLSTFAPILPTPSHMATINSLCLWVCFYFDCLFILFPKFHM